MSAFSVRINIHFKAHLKLFKHNFGFKVTLKKVQCRQRVFSQDQLHYERLFLKSKLLVIHLQRSPIPGLFGKLANKGTVMKHACKLQLPVQGKLN